MADERDDAEALNEIAATLLHRVEQSNSAEEAAPFEKMCRDFAALRARLAEAEGLRETLRRLKRTGELSAAIMRDTRRTGAWEGAERTARAFERMGEFADRALKGAPDAG
jgi:hypothetical protein